METTGGILAVNQKTEEETEALYEKILAEFEKNTGK